MVDEVPVNMIRPFFVWNGDDVQLYASLAEAEAAIESIDVLQGDYQAFAANGEPLDVKATRKIERLWGVPLWWDETLEILPASDPSAVSPALDARLRRHLTWLADRIGQQDTGRRIDELSLEELVDLACDWHNFRRPDK